MDKTNLAKRLNQNASDVELIKLPDLIPNVYYKIIDIYKTINVYGRETVIATIERNSIINKTFLPSKYYSYNKSDLIGLEFRYNGKGLWKGREYHKIEFNEEYPENMQWEG